MEGEEGKKRAGQGTGDGNDESPEMKRRREAETVEFNDDVLAWLSMDEEGCNTDAMSELLKLVDGSAERTTSSTCSTASCGVKVRFSDNPYSSAFVFQSSSSYITINGNEESCGSSFSDSESSVMASVDMGGIVNWNVNVVNGLEEIRGWLEEEDGGAWGTSEGGTRWEWDQEQLARAVRSPALEDRIRWIGGTSGLYCVKDYCNASLASEEQSDSVWPKIWLNVAPLKVEAFLWRLVLNRIPTGMELAKRGVELNGITCCPLCRKEPETVAHLFLHCQMSWQIWQKWFRMWDVPFIMPMNIESFILAWEEVKVKKDAKLIWSMAIRGIIWTIWRCRNTTVFEGKDWRLAEIFENAMMCTGQWCRWKWPNSCASAVEFCRCPALVSIPGKLNERLKVSSWVAPEVGYLKFNVDAAFSSVDRVAGIGGILRNSEGSQLLVFSRCIGKADPTQAELVSLLEACRIFADSVWSKSHNLVLESDCELAINWIQRPQCAPAVFSSLAKDIGGRILSNKWQLRFAYREANSKAHNLAKIGASSKHNIAALNV